MVTNLQIFRMILPEMIYHFNKTEERKMLMTAERLSELQDLALAGQKPEGSMTEEERQAWENTRNRMDIYKQKIRKIFQEGGRAYGKDNG